MASAAGPAGGAAVVHRGRAARGRCAPADAHLLADTLVTAELWGTRPTACSAALVRRPPAQRGDEPVTRIERVRDTGALVVLDGGNGIGQVITDRAISWASSGPASTA